jgi:transposase-like protein
MDKWQSIDNLFDGLPFDREVIVFCVHWYLRFKLSFRDLVEMMSERGLSLAHTTIMRWVNRFTPEFVKCWNPLCHGSWSVVASRRNVCEDPRQVGLSLPCS